MAIVKKILWSVFVALSGIFTAFFVEKGLKSIDPLKKNAGEDVGESPADETETTTETETETSAEETPAEETSDDKSE